MLLCVYVCTCSQVEAYVILCDYIASCPCNDVTNNAVRTVCTGPSTAPCMCNDESCKVSEWSI